MSFVDKDYYVDTFHGESVSDADFPSLLERATEIVEEMCSYRISESCLAKYPQEVQERFKKAICAQIEYLDANGGSDMDNGVNLQSAGLGKFNYSRAADGNGNSSQSIYAPRAWRYLVPTGLLYRGEYL